VRRSGCATGFLRFLITPRFFVEDLVAERFAAERFAAVRFFAGLFAFAMRAFQAGLKSWLIS
jgi:hypothetical protein